MVWVAFKRNDSQMLSSQDRRECPLLRCRKRFPNHELMLQHLYLCEELAAGEYWCYDCGRAERFTDTKCKRCLGHPSKRRKIMFMAKNFFSSLGHRGSKPSSLPDLDMDFDEAPPTYHESLDVPATPRPRQIELQANEIHEIDSNEIQLPTIVEDAEEDPISMSLQMPQMSQMLQPMPHVSNFSPLRPNTDPAELESANWYLPAQPTTVAPANLSLLIDNQQATSPAVRPTLQVQTTNLAQPAARAQAPRRSKPLAPSSSVRSTASTNSTNSTASSGSYAISPMTSSSWSDVWARGPGFESTLTTPADEFAPSNPFGHSSKPVPEFSSSNPSQSQDGQPGVSDRLDVNMEQSVSTELPADIPIMVGVISPSEPTVASSSPSQHSFPFNTVTPSDLSLGAGLPLNGDPQDQTRFPRTEPELTSSPQGRTHSLVQTAWGTLQMHLSESMERLRNIEDNHLVGQLLAMSPELVASTGLKTLDSILDRTIVESPIDLLCFIHLVYSISLVIHGEDAPNRGNTLFSQAISYASALTKMDHHPYFTIVDALWKPNGMKKSDVIGLMRKTSSAAASRSKGKQPHHLAPGPSTDSLAFVAEFFLDGEYNKKRIMHCAWYQLTSAELEYSAIQDTNHPNIQTSDLCIHHMMDPTFHMAEGSQIDMRLGSMKRTLTQQHADVPKFVARLGDLVNRVKSSNGSTVRRLELELMNVGKVRRPGIDDSKMNLTACYLDDPSSRCLLRQVHLMHSRTCRCSLLVGVSSTKLPTGLSSARHEAHRVNHPSSG